MPPGGCAEMPGVIIRVSRPRKAVIRHFVPFFARDLASFAADANGRISEESNFDVFLYVIVTALICAVSAFANHAKNRIRKAGTQENRAEEHPVVRAK